jgi:hypothetical protein
MFPVEVSLTDEEVMILTVRLLVLEANGEIEITPEFAVLQ